MVWPLIAAGISLVSNLGAANQAKQTAAINQSVRKLQALDARSRGVADVRRLRMQAKAFASSQTAGFAGQNVALESGVVLDTAESTAFVTEMDAIAILNNAAREAWGLEVDAQNIGKEGAAAASGYAAQGVGSVIGGLGSIFGG